MEGIPMETDGTLYKINHCKECDLQFFAKPGSLNRFCNTCRKKKVFQLKKVFSTRVPVNALKGVSA